MGEIQLSGFLEYSSSKRGIRYCELHVAEPYHHSTFVDITWDAGRETDDNLNDDMLGYYGNAVIIDCIIDQYGDLSSTPSKITLVSAKAIEARRVETERLDAQHESAGRKALPNG